MPNEDLSQKYLKVKEYSRKVQQDSVRLEERLKSLENEKQELLVEVRAAGYDPDNLESEISIKHRELEAAVANYSGILSRIQEQLNVLLAD
jgi:uncharacterized protein (UPF0335 family)